MESSSQSEQASTSTLLPLGLALVVVAAALALADPSDGVLNGGVLNGGALNGGALNGGEAGPVEVDYGSDVDLGAVFDPDAAGEDMPYGFFRVFGRDVIRPVYQPRFATADEIGWPDNADVIGVSIDGQSKAYPVSYLNGRQMAMDELAGEPLTCFLVTDLRNGDGPSPRGKRRNTGLRQPGHPLPIRHDLMGPRQRQHLEPAPWRGVGRASQGSNP